MRPILDTKKIFARDRADRDTSRAPDSASSRMRSPLAQSVIVEPPAPRESHWQEVTRERSERAAEWQADSARAGADVERTEAPNHGFPQLDRFLASRVLRLEVTGEDQAALSDARVIRAALARAGALAALAIPGRSSFESGSRGSH